MAVRITEMSVRFLRCQSGVSMVEFALVLVVSAAVASAIMRAGELAAVLAGIFRLSQLIRPTAASR